MSSDPTTVIQVAVCDEYGVSLAAMLGPARHKTLAWARHVAIYLARLLTQQSYAELGERFRRDHTTAMASVEAVEAVLARNTPELARVKSIERRIVAAIDRPSSATVCIDVDGRTCEVFHRGRGSLVVRYPVVGAGAMLMVVSLSGRALGAFFADGEILSAIAYSNTVVRCAS